MYIAGTSSWYLERFDPTVAGILSSPVPCSFLPGPVGFMFPGSWRNAGVFCLEQFLPRVLCIPFRA